MFQDTQPNFTGTAFITYIFESLITVTPDTLLFTHSISYVKQRLHWSLFI